MYLHTAYYERPQHTWNKGNKTLADSLAHSIGEVYILIFNPLNHTGANMHQDLMPTQHYGTTGLIHISFPAQRWWQNVIYDDIAYWSATSSENNHIHHE